MQDEKCGDFAGATEHRGPTSVLSRDDFASALRRALRHYQRLEILEASPLLASRVVGARLRRAESPETPTQALREAIREQCESWGNAPKTVVLQRVLTLTYLEPMRSQQAVADALNMSWSTYRRRLAEARELLTTQLWQTEQLLATKPAPEPETKKEGKATRQRGHRARYAATSLVGVLVIAGLLAWHFGPWHAANGAQATVPSIAVLPFENLSADPANAYFAAGIQDEILTRLASIGSLKVISRTSTASYASRPNDLRTIARQLGVTTVLEGSVQKSGDEVHVNVQLIDAHTQAHIWAQSYNRKLTDVFGVEGQVAQEIANALSAKLLPRERTQISRVPTRNPLAYDFFLKANYYANRTFNQGNVKNPANSVREAVSLYRQATAQDPHFALAWARLSLLESQAWWYDIGSGVSRMSAARNAAKRALALDPNLHRAHMAMGYVEYYGHRDYPAALEQFEQARGNLPNGADVIAAIAFIHRRQGKWRLALKDLRQMATLDPRNPRRYYEIGVTLTELRHYQAAEKQFNVALAIEPHDYVTLAYKIRSLFLAGENTRARRELAAVPGSADPQGSFSALRFESAWLARNPEQALAVLQSAPARVLGMATLSVIPTNLLRAKAWALAGNVKSARQAYTDARATLRVELQQQPHDPPSWGALGMAEAGLGEKQKAIQAGMRATQLRPISKDAYYGPVHLAALAKIYAQTGATARAVGLLRRLLAMPAGGVVSIPLLRLDPVWDPIRHDPRFQALLKHSGRPAPAPHAGGTDQR